MIKKAYAVMLVQLNGSKTIVTVCLDKVRAKAIITAEEPKLKKSLRWMEIEEVKLDTIQFCRDRCCDEVMRKAYEED